MVFIFGLSKLGHDTRCTKVWMSRDTVDKVIELRRQRTSAIHPLNYGQ